MFTRKRTFIALAGISILIALFASTRSARMQGTPPANPVPRFGLIGISIGQIARINAVKGIQPVPFRVRLGFVDADGIPLYDRAGNEIAREVELMAGHGAWLDLEARDVLSRSELRKQIRPVVTILPVAGVPPDRVIVTLEIFNRLSGRTEVLYVPSASEVSGIDPSPF